jgi:hypothetical protein
LALQKRIETLNENLVKGMPFKTKPLKMIKINNVEVSEKMPTLAIKDKSEVTPILTRKATIEEAPDKEAPTLVDNQQLILEAIIEEMPPLVINSEDSNEEPLKATTLKLDEIKEDEMIITYIKGEPVIGIFEKNDTLFTRDHYYLKYNYSKNSSGIRQISTLIRSARYTFGQDI